MRRSKQKSLVTAHPRDVGDGVQGMALALGKGSAPSLGITLPALDASREGRWVSRRGRAAACEK